MSLKVNSSPRPVSFEETGPCIKIFGLMYVGVQLFKEVVTKGLPGIAKETISTFQDVGKEGKRSLLKLATKSLIPLKIIKESTINISHEIENVSKIIFDETANSLSDGTQLKSLSHLILEPYQDFLKESVITISEATSILGIELLNAKKIFPIVQDSSKEFAFNVINETSLTVKKSFIICKKCLIPSIHTINLIELSQTSLKHILYEKLSMTLSILKEIKNGTRVSTEFIENYSIEFLDNSIRECLLLVQASLKQGKKISAEILDLIKIALVCHEIIEKILQECIDIEISALLEEIKVYRKCVLSFLDFISTCILQFENSVIELFFISVVIRNEIERIYQRCQYLIFTLRNNFEIVFLFSKEIQNSFSSFTKEIHQKSITILDDTKKITCSGIFLLESVGSEVFLEMIDFGFEIRRKIEYSNDMKVMIRLISDGTDRIINESYSEGKSLIKEGKNTLIKSSQTILQSIELISPQLKSLKAESISLCISVSSQGAKSLMPSLSTQLVLSSLSKNLQILGQELEKTSNLIWKECKHSLLNIFCISQKIIFCFRNGMELLLHETYVSFLEGGSEVSKLSIFLKQKTILIYKDMEATLLQTAFQIYASFPLKEIKKQISFIYNTKEIYKLLEIKNISKEIASVNSSIIKSSRTLLEDYQQDIRISFNMVTESGTQIINEWNSLSKAVFHEIEEIAKKAKKIIIHGISINYLVFEKLALTIFDYVILSFQEIVEIGFLMFNQLPFTIQSIYQISKSIASEIVEMIFSGIREMPKIFKKCLIILGPEIFLQSISEIIYEIFIFMHDFKNIIKQKQVISFNQRSNSIQIPVNFTIDWLEESFRFIPSLGKEIEKGWDEMQEDFPSTWEHFIRGPLEISLILKKRKIKKQKERIQSYFEELNTNIEEYIRRIKSHWNNI